MADELVFVRSNYDQNLSCDEIEREASTTPLVVVNNPHQMNVRNPIIKGSHSSQVARVQR